MQSSRSSYGSPPKSSPRKTSNRPFIILDEAVFDELRQTRQVPETLLVTLLAIKALIGSNPQICVYDPRRPDESLYARLEVLRHRAITTLQDHVSSLRAEHELIDIYTGENGQPYIRLTLPETPIPPGRKRSPFIRIDLGLMRYCRYLVRCVMPRSKQGWETVFISWMALKRVENRVSGLCCPSYQTLATSRGRHPITLMRHIRLLISAGIIERHWSPWPTRRRKTRYRSNHYILLAPATLLRLEQGEVVGSGRGKLMPKPDALNHKENIEIYQLERAEEKVPTDCPHTPQNALPYPMWKCRDCGDVFEASVM